MLMVGWKNMKHPYLKFQFPEFNKEPDGYRAKLRYLFAKHKQSKIFEENELELMGLVDMVGGLEYHYENFARMEGVRREEFRKFIEEKSETSTMSENIIHEAVAYLNRLGQVYTLLKSKWVQRYLMEENLAVYCPTILSLIPLRNKFASHRSIDDPRGETPTQLANHAALSYGVNWGGKKITNDSLALEFDGLNIVFKIQISKNHRSLILTKFHPTLTNDIEEFSGETLWVNFTLTNNHPIICDEIINVIKKILTTKLS